MGKSSLNKAGTDTVGQTTGPTAASANEGASSAGGELGQLQEILFGQQQRNTTEQIGALQTELVRQIETLSNVLNSRLNQLTDTVEKNKKNIEQQIQTMQDDHQSSLANLSTQIKSSNTDIQKEIASLAASSNADAKRLDAELAQSDAKLRGQLNESKDSLRAEFKQQASELQSAKLDKQNLASLLSEISTKLTETTPATAK